MTRSHRTKRNDGKPSRGRNGAALDGSSATSKTVMIVEDNELNMKLFHDLLEAYGYHPIGTRNGSEALDLARKHRPDLILMDIQLPDRLRGLFVEADPCAPVPRNHPPLSRSRPEHSGPLAWASNS